METCGKLGIGAREDVMFAIQDWTTGQLNALVKRVGESTAKRMLSDEFKVCFAEAPLLTFVRTLVPTSAKPTIIGRGSNFSSWFDGVAEGERSAKLTLRKLERPSLDAPIIAVLGGEAKAEVTLADFCAALAQKEAARDFTWLIAYVKDKNGVIRMVYGLWDDGGWHVNADAVENPDGWRDGPQVLSRN